VFGLLGQIVASWSNSVRALVIVVVVVVIVVVVVVGGVVVGLKVLNADVTAGPVSIVGRATPVPAATAGGLP
jgi:hypothetical protein